MIKNNKGFTLIELVATIAIMLIIVSIALPTSLNFIADGKEQEYELIIDKIEVAAQDYYKENSVGVGEIQISDIIDYIELEDKYFKGNKVKDPREDGKCLNGSIIVSYDSSTNVQDKMNFQYNVAAISVDC